MANINEMDQAQIHKGQKNTYLLQGRWATRYLDSLHFILERMDWPTEKQIIFDSSALNLIDTNGAILLLSTMQDLERQGYEVQLQGTHPNINKILDLVRNYLPSEQSRETVRRSLPIRVLERLGKRATQKFNHGLLILGFLGRVTTKIINFFPVSFRSFKQFWIHIEHFGVNALPIVGLLSFLIGVVLAYQMGIQLQQYGGNIYIVDFATFAILREFGPLIAAIIFAGRTGSSITAQLASMKLSEEIAALQVMGISPYERLVLPRIIALLICVPLVTVWADITGILGAMAMGHHMFDINYLTFIDRVSSSISLRTYLTGLVKTPVFALIIGIIGCFQGFNVAERSDAVGQNTTLSVVQSIFLIIVADALFSVMFSWRTL